MSLLFTPHKKTFAFAGQPVSLLIPDIGQVREEYSSGVADGKPYWTAVWPAAEALCVFIAEHSYLFEGKEVWEPGAGLALPSLVAARYAAVVRCSDLYPQAVEFMKASVALNRLHNVKAEVMDWNQLPLITADVVLLSDVGYEPQVFDDVLAMVGSFLVAGALIVLSVPARLASSPFLGRLGARVIMRKEYLVNKKEVLVVVLSESVSQAD